MPDLAQPKPRRTPRRSTTRTPAVTTDSEPEVINLTAVDRTAMIAEAAYFRAESRHFEPGHELDDWLEAEAQIDGMLMARAGEQTSL